MLKKKKHILWLEEIEQSDVKLVGVKNAALGEVYNALKKDDIKVPNAFAVTAEAYYFFLEKAKIRKKIEQIFQDIEIDNLKKLNKASRKAQRLILKSNWPSDLKKEIILAYRKLSREFDQINTDVAVRASMVVGQSIASSFPGQQETFLGINQEDQLLRSVKKCFASLFNSHAIVYRTEKNLSLFDIALSVGVQKMVRSDLASSGVAFTIDPESGFDKVVTISSSYGLGEIIVDGKTDPDEFLVFKPSLAKGYRSIIKRKLGQKEKKGVYGRRGVKIIPVPENERKKFSLNDRDVILLAQWCVAIEDYYSKLNNRYVPQEIEWAKDGQTGMIFIVQSSPESAHGGKRSYVHREYKFKTDQSPLLEGISVGRKIISGPVRIVKSAKDLKRVKKGDILTTSMTDFQWVSLASQLGGIIADQGSRTSHASIISREYGISAVINTGRATKILKDREVVTIDNSSGSIGRVYRGKLPFETTEHNIENLPSVEPKVAINISRSDGVFNLSFLPVSGVGLLREEFMIMEEIKIHPRALCLFDQIKQKEVKKEIEILTYGYEDKKEYFVDKLSQSIGMIASAFWPRPVVVRFSDLKTNEYRQLIGGELFEPKEENPMIGWRGASRYYHPEFRSVFELECRAIKRAREEWGLTNIMVMVPFCRTPEEGRKVISLMSEFGLKKGVEKLAIYFMAEIPSNIILADHFLEIFDGCSIGSNDLTQLILGIDRDNHMLQSIGSERNLAVKQAIKEIIEWAHASHKTISLCGEGPVNFPDLALFLADHNLDSISVAPEAVIPMILLLAEHGHQHYKPWK